MENTTKKIAVSALGCILLAATNDGGWGEVYTAGAVAATANTVFVDGAGDALWPLAIGAFASVINGGAGIATLSAVLLVVAPFIEALVLGI